MDGLIDFIEPIPSGEAFLAKGSIGWAPVAFLNDLFREICFSNPNPADFFKGYINLREHSGQECLDRDSTVFCHHPIHSEHLRANEAYGAVRHKLRPAVVLAEVKSYPKFHERLARELRQRFPSCFLCAPIHSLTDKDGKWRVTNTVLDKLRSYQMPMAFYLGPGDGLRPGIVRFDRIQPIAQDFLKTHKTRLTTDCQSVFDDWLGLYLFGSLRQDSPIRLYWDELRNMGKDLADIPTEAGL